MSINKLAVDDDARTYACAESNHDEVLHALCCTISHFADCSSIGIVGQFARNAYTFTKELCKWYDTLPREVRSKFDVASVIVAVRSTYTHTIDLFLATY